MYINSLKFLAFSCLLSFSSLFANSNFDEQKTILQNIDGKKSTIDIGNLTIGQTGVVIHKYNNDLETIVSNAKVINSNENQSIIEFFPFNDLKQDAIATTKKEASIDDIFVLNYLYKNSLLIAPNFDTFNDISKKFSKFNFIHPDIFGAKLKFSNSLYPSKKEIQEFAIEQNLGTIFIAVLDKIYILDSKTFTIISELSHVQNSSLDKKLPFFTRVEDIKESLVNFKVSSWFSKKDDFDSYYKKILGIKQ